MLFVLVMSGVICVFTHERVCNCLFRCHSMLFVLNVTCIDNYTLVHEKKTHVTRLITSTNNIE